jgi:O-antigen/teichoic acid export membrane protein
MAGQSIAAANWFALTLLLDVAGTEALGTFMIALRIVTGASFIPMSVVDASLGRLHRGAIQIQEPTQAKSLLTRSFLVAVVTALTLIVSAPAISLLGTDYGPAVTTIRILALSLPLITVNVVLGNVALSRRRMRLWAFSDVILAATLLLGTTATIQSFEANGLAASMGISYIVSVIVLAFPMRVWQSGQGKRSQ